MTKLSIKSKLFISAAVSTVGVGLITKVLYWLNADFSTNVNFTNTENIFYKSLPYITNYAHLVFKIAFFAICMAVVSYARAHFGPATAYKTCFITLGAFVFCEAVNYGYNVIFTTFNDAQFKATLLSVGTEILYLAVLVFLTPLFTELRLKSLAKNKTQITRLSSAGAVVPAIALYFAVNLAELVIYTIDATKTYISHGNSFTASVAISIVLDVIYYFMLYFVAPAAIALLAIFTLTKITGPLKLKIKGDSSKK